MTSVWNRYSNSVLFSCSGLYSIINESTNQPDPQRVELGWLWSVTSKYHLHAHIGQEYKGFPNPRPSTQCVQRKGLLSNWKRPDISRKQNKEGGFCTSQPKWDWAGQQGVHSSPPRLLSRRLLFCRAGSGGEAGPVLAQRNRAPSVTEQPVRVTGFLKGLRWNLAAAGVFWQGLVLAGELPEFRSDAELRSPCPSPRHSPVCVCLPVVLLKSHSG